MISIKETSELKNELISKAQEKHKKAKSFKQFRKDAGRTPLKKGEVRKLVNGKWVSNKKEEVEHIEEMASASNLKFGIPKGLPGLGGGGGGTDAISAKSKSKTLGKTVKDAGKLATTPFRALLGIKSKQDPREKFASEAKSAAWQRKEGKNKKGGLNEKGRKSYERENPGSDLKAPQPGGGPRKRSFCARMGGVKGPMKKPDGSPTRKALALRKWKC